MLLVAMVVQDQKVHLLFPLKATWLNQTELMKHVESEITFAIAPGKVDQGKLTALTVFLLGFILSNQIDSSKLI